MNTTNPVGNPGIPISGNPKSIAELLQDWRETARRWRMHASMNEGWDSLERKGDEYERMADEVERAYEAEKLAARATESGIAIP